MGAGRGDFYPVRNTGCVAYQADAAQRFQGALHARLVHEGI
jgi:hypothetical protein